MPEQTVVPAASTDAVTTREQTRAEERYVAPPVDIYEDKEGLVVVADVPGAETSGLDVRVDQGILTIQAKTAHNGFGQPTRREYELVNFFRQFQLPEKVAADKISADLTNGVLKLRLPWAPEVKPRKIEVRTA
jgi:HSP20 family protein